MSRSSRSPLLFPRVVRLWIGLVPGAWGACGGGGIGSVLLAAVLGFAPARAAEHCVRAGADQAQDGTDWDNAYPALPETLLRGDVYYIADGSYPGARFDTAASGTTPITLRKATPADHGTGTGWSDAFGDGQAVFEGMLEFSSSNWIVDGQTGGGAGSWGAGFGFKIVERADANALIRIGYSGTADGIEIRHVELEGKGSVSTQGGSYSNDGLALYGVRGVTLSRFWMHGIGRCPFFVSAQDVVVEHGWVESFYGSEGVHSEIASIWSFDGEVGDMTFRYNLFTDSQSTGGIMWDNSANPAARLLVYGNVFYQDPGVDWSRANGVIGGWTGGSGEEFRNATVCNNTFIDIDYMPLSSLPQVYSGNQATNNLFVRTASPDFSRFEDHDFNAFIDAGGTHGEPDGTSATGVDPFVDYPGLDFGLEAATAPGLPLAPPFDRDPLGRVRGADGVWDRGAFEFDAGGPDSPPLAPINLRVSPTN